MNLESKQIECGDVFHVNAGGSATVIEYRNSREVVIKYNDEYGHIATVAAYDLRRGKVKNPYHPVVCGVGFVGFGDHLASIKRKHTPAYIAWKDMLKRCYNPKYHARFPTYIGCSVIEDWHNFQIFAEWFEKQYREEGWHLDKDLIVRGNKIYSETTCALIPHQLNNLLTNSQGEKGVLPKGVARHGDGYIAQIRVDGENCHLGVYPTADEAFQSYRDAKERNIKRMAEKWKSLIDIRVYDALMSYDV